MQSNEIPPARARKDLYSKLFKAGAVQNLIEKGLLGRTSFLQDAHPWNILFHGSKPMFVDFCSIVAPGSSSRWPAENEFYRFFVCPLRLMSRGHGRIAICCAIMNKMS